MAKLGVKVSRRSQILTALAKMLADSPGERITTSVLAKSVGVSEAALYRHFPSKTKMFEGLIELIEETVFSQMTLILAEEQETVKCCELFISALLTFIEQHAGLSRLLVGDALTGETARLRQRIVQFFERIETQLKQLLLNAEQRQHIYLVLDAPTFAHFLLSYVDGVIVQFVRSEFQTLPNRLWLEQWQILAPLLISTPSANKP